MVSDVFMVSAFNINFSVSLFLVFKLFRSDVYDFSCVYCASLCVLLQEYLECVDPGSHLGLSEQSIAGYWLSRTFRTIRKSLLMEMVCFCDV